MAYAEFDNNDYPLRSFPDMYQIASALRQLGAGKIPRALPIEYVDGRQERLRIIGADRGEFGSGKWSFCSVDAESGKGRTLTIDFPERSAVACAFRGTVRDDVQIVPPEDNPVAFTVTNGPSREDLFTALCFGPGVLRPTFESHDVDAGITPKNGGCLIIAATLLDLADMDTFLVQVLGKKRGRHKDLFEGVYSTANRRGEFRLDPDDGGEDSE